MHEWKGSVRSLLWKVAVTASMGVGLLWLCGYPVGAEGGILGGPDGRQAWFEPGSAEPVAPSVEVAFR